LLLPTEDPIETVLSTRPIPPGPPHRSWTRWSSVTATSVGVVWLAALVAIARQPLFLTTDMVSNHVHVWFVAKQLWHGHHIPLRMPVLASGDARTFPYATLPWIVGALLWPLGGDHVVTLLHVAGALGCVAATFWAFPALRRGWWVVAVLLNPALIASVLLGQLPFLWAVTAFIGAIGMWRRQRTVWATVLLTVSLVTHPAVMLPVSVLALAFGLPVESHRARLGGCWAIAALISVPAMAMTLDSPVVAESSRWQVVGNLVATVLVRALVPAIPLALDAATRRRWVAPRLPIAVAVVSVALVAAMWRPFLLRAGWSGITRTHLPTELVTFVTRPPLQPGRTYRVLSGGDEKYDLYAVVRNGGVLDSELFPESLHRKGFASEEQYARFLVDRHVASIVLTPGYETHFSSNEPRVLRAFVAAQRCTDGIRIVTGPSDVGWQEYTVRTC
jgi:hypothetical protein